MSAAVSLYFISERMLNCEYPLHKFANRVSVREFETHVKEVTREEKGKLLKSPEWRKYLRERAKYPPIVPFP